MASIHDKFSRAIKQIIENDQRARAGLPYNTGNSISDKFERAIQEIRERDNASRQNTSSQPALTPSRTPSSTPASPLPSFATGSGNTVESVLGRFSGRGGVEAIKSPDSWSSAGDAELGLKAWSGQLDGYEKKLTELSGDIANTENRLKSLQTTAKTAEDAAAYDELYAGYERMIADYNGVVNDFNRVQDKYSAGVERYRDILSGGMERAETAAAEAKRLEDENSRLQRQANLIRIYEMSGTSPSSAAAPIEAQIEQNAQRIQELQAEESRNKMQYYSSLALMEDYADLSAPGKVTGDSRYDYINDIDSARYRNEHTTDPSGAPVALRRYQYLTEDEIKIYNYLYASQGKEAADRFLEDMGPALTERQGTAQYEKLGALGKALYWIPAGLDQFGSGIRQLFQREAVPVSSTQITSQLIQQEAQEKSPVLGTLYTLGTTLSNMAPSILASALGSWALGAAGLSAGTAAAVGRATGAATLGASAGGNAFTQKLNEGYSSEAAQNYATLVGASEGALQYLLGGIGALSKSGTGRIAAKIAGLDNALGRVARTVSGSTAARLLGSMISEGTEEGLQELLEPAFAAIIFDEEYEADFEDAAYAFLLGALSAGIIEGPAAIDYARRPAGFSFRDMDGYADNGVDYFEGANTLEEVEARYRDLARQYHPDLGGDAATMAEINRQRTMARAFFRGRAEAAQEEEQAEPQRPEAEDGVIRRLNAPAATTAQEAAPAAEPAVQTEQESGIVLPTAEDAGDFTPRAAAETAPMLEVSRAAAPEISAEGNIVLPTADDTMIGGIANGQQEGQQQDFGGDVGRDADIGPRGQAERLDRGAGRRAAPADQSRAALARQNSAKDLRLEPVSSAELGIPEGTDTRNVRVLPREDWDDALLGTAEQVQSVTGRGTRFVLGSIEVRTTDGGTHRVRGVWRPEGDIIIQADNLRVSPRQIADHEIYHELAAQNPGLDADVEARIRERFSEEEFGRVVESYIQKLRGVIDLPENASEAEFEAAMNRILQEIYADAYAGINAFGARADRFAEPARAAVQERTGIGRETEEARRDRTGPPEERYSYAGVNAAAADLETLDVAERQTTSEEPRRQTAPDVGDEETTFAEIPGDSDQRSYDDDALPIKSRFSLSEPVERTADLVAVHNIEPYNLERTLDLGAFPMPSIAIIRGDAGHDIFGDISVVFGADTIDPAADSRNRVYSRDAWTPRFPKADTSGLSPDEIVTLMQRQPERQDSFGRPAMQLLMSSVERYGSLDEIIADENRIDSVTRTSTVDFAEIQDDLQHTADSLATPENTRNTFSYKLDDLDILTYNKLQGVVYDLAKAKNEKVEERMLFDDELPDIWADAVEDAQYAYELEADRFVQLLAMTPHYMRTVENALSQEGAAYLELTPDEARAAIDAVNEVEDTVWNESSQEEINNQFDDWAESVIITAAKGPHTLEAIKTALKNGGLTPADSSAEAVLNLINKTASVGTKYLEAKPYRVVNFDEILGVVVPDDTSQSLLDRLAEKSIPVIEYRAEDETDRTRAINSIENARFSVNEEGDSWSDDNLDKTDYEGAALSQEQADFFKDSKIRLDEDGGYWYGNGKLLPVYHATWSDEFTVFDPAYLGENTDSNVSDEWLGATAHTGFWFNTQNLAEGQRAGKRAEKVYLNITEPYEVGGVAELADLIYERAEEDETSAEAAQKFVQELKADGYDGLIILKDGEFGGMSFVAFEPNQIKRVSNESPTVDADIRYSVESSPTIEGYEDNAPKPVIAKQDLRRRLLDTFSVPPGSRAELGRIIEGFADKMIRSGRYTEQDRSALFDKLYDAGAMTLTADPYYSDARGALVKRRMYVSDALKAEFGDDWNDFRKRAFAAGIFLTNDPNDMAPDMWQAELGETLPGLFDSDNLDMRSFMERVVQVAEEGRDEQVSLAEYTQMLAGENYVSEDEVLQDLEQRVDWELRNFAEKADLEVRLRGRGADGITNTERKRIIQEERANYWQLHKQYQEETRQRIAEERQKRHASEKEAREKIDNIIREEREKYWQKRREYQQRADERVRQEREKRWAAQAETRQRIDDVEQAERRTYYERLERYKEARRATDARERERRKAMSERRRETAELRNLQQRTLKQIQWLAKNQYRAPAELKQHWDEVLGDLDIFAVSAANEMNYSKKFDATWRDISEMYKKARDTDPNFLPSQELERIVARLDNDKIGDLDIGALQDLYKAAVGLRQEFYNRNHVIGDEEARLFSELYADSKEEINSAPGGYSKNPADKVFNLEQLTPMNYLERMAGWNPDSAWYSMAKQLEAGERNERAYIVQANALLADWLEENEEWVLRSDGQGKDAVWYEIEVPELLELGMGDKPVFGDSVKVWMTPSMKVHLYLESKNYDNLRHMVGGRTFPDKELYSEGKRQEAFAQGKTVRLAPETVKKLVSDLTPEERELAALLERYYNQFAAERINKVSNALYGYDRAVTTNYAPIYTNSNYNQKEIGKFDQTAEGVGNLKQRIRGAKNPSYNLSAYDAFERHVDQTARFVGMAIPARNWKTLLNWRERNDSMSDVITHKWGNESLKYITDLLTDLQGGSPRKAQFQISSFADKLWSNYISAVFGANPSIVLKQLGSIPLGGAYLGMENVPTPRQMANIDRDLIALYTSELDWRLMGYATPETKQLKDHPNWTQRNSFFRNVFGGGAITGMDGWAASTLWPWAENKVRRERPELEVGTEEQVNAGQSPFYKAVAAEFDNAVNRSQSMSDTLHNARIRKADNAILRTLTMFKSDAAQTYNAFRQTIGEAQYYKRTGASSKTQRTARAAMGAAFLAWIVNAAWTAGVNFLVNLAKTKGKNYRDDEDELTAESVLGKMATDMISGMSGVVILGEELAGALGSAVTGERWYGLDAPGIEQLNDTLESIINSSKSLKKLLTDAVNIGRQGGDVLAYLNSHRADIIGGIKDVAATAVTYFPGLPVNNVEAYLAGLISWALPSVGTAYEDLFETPEKADLSGLEGDALVTRVTDILGGRLDDVSEKAAEDIATLYAAGYSEALPAGVPTQITVTDKDTDTSETVELDAYQRQFFERVWTETVGRAVDDLVAMPEYEQASPDEQVKMLNQIYRFANETAKAETIEKYSPPSTIAEAAEDIADGRTLAEWAAYDVLSDDVSGTFGKLTDEGLGYEQALDVAETVNELGDDSTAVERYLAVAQMPIPEDEKELALRGIMTDSAYSKYETARAAGIDTLDYCEFLDRISDISGDGRQERVWALIDSMRLTNRQKDVLHLAAGYKDSTLSKTPWHN